MATKKRNAQAQTLRTRVKTFFQHLFTGRTLVIGTPYLWLLLTFLLPFLIVLGVSFKEMPDSVNLSNTLSLDHIDTAEFTLKLSSYWRLFTDSLYWKSYLDSTIYAIATTILCLLIGYPFAYFLVRLPKKWQPMLLMGIMIPFWTSFLLRVYAWKGLLNADSGAVGMLISSLGIDEILISLGLIKNAGVYLYTPLAMLLGMTYTYLPFMVLPLFDSLSKVDDRLLEAAEDLGATPWQSFWKITVPLTKTGIIAGMMLVFIPCLGEYVIPKILGDASIITIGRTLMDEFSTITDWPMASALTVVMILIIIIPMAIFNNAMSKRGEEE